MSIRIRNKQQQQLQPEEPLQASAGGRPSLADDIRHRMAERRAGRPVGMDNAAGGTPFFLFGKADLVVLCVLLAIVYFIVRAEYQVDLAQWLWRRYLKPSYDDDHWDL